MPDYAFEDLRPGLSLSFGPVTIDAEAIVAFAREYDFQPFHVDAAAAERSFAGGLIASGWHTCALTMRLLCDDFVLRSTSMGSPGIEEVRWLRPVRPGDALSARITVREARPSRSRPDRGLVRCFVETLDGAGRPVMTQDFTVLFARRDAVPEPRPVAPPPAAQETRAPPDAPAEGRPRPMPYLEDLVPGTVETFPPRLFTAEDIVGFARAFDPQPFHVDEAAARASHFGGLCASGWQTAATWMRQMLLARGPATTEGARVGPSPGFRDLKWLRPVYAGDVVTYASKLTDARPSLSRPGWGIARNHNTGHNQHGELVFSYEGAVLWERRPG